MKKILILVGVLVAVIATVSIGTYAYFSDTQTSTNNLFTAGTLDLGLDNTGSSSSTGDTTATFSANTWTPGSTTSSATLGIRNAGNVTMGHVYVVFTYGTNTNNDDGTINTSGRPTNISGTASVTFTPTNGGSGAAGIAEVTSGGYIAGVIITNGGTGYNSPPTVSFTGSGTNAAGTANLSGTSVASVTMTNDGSGYNAWGQTTDAFDKMITVATCSWNGVSQTGSGNTANIVGQSLYQLRAAGPTALYDTGYTLGATEKSLVMTFNYSSTATNGTQGNVLTLKVVATGTQQ